MSLPEHDATARSSVAALGSATALDDSGFTERMLVLIQNYGGVSRIARLCGFSEGVVRSWRDGRSDPSRARCIALAHGLGVSLTWLMSGEGNMLNGLGPHAAGDEMAPPVDVHRLSDAMRVLQSTLESTGNSLSLESRAELLGEYYAALGNPDPVARAEGFGEVHKHLMQRIREAHAQPQMHD